MANRLQTIAGDTSGQPFSRDLQEPAYAATIAISPNSGSTVIKPGTLTGAATINATVTDCKANDEITLVLTADGSGPYNVTPGTGFVDGGVIAVAASKQATWTGIFDGTAFVEKARFVEP